MGDIGDTFKEYRKLNKSLRDKFGVDCPECNIKQPRRTPTLLLPGQRCKVCGFRDPRPRSMTDGFKESMGWFEKK